MAGVSIDRYDAVSMHLHIWLIMLGIAAAAGCAPTSYPSGTTITPAHFQFVTINEPDGKHGGGWREVCIRARASQDVQGTNVSQHVCDVGVGMPILLQNGRYIALPEAQQESAVAANAAAYSNLTRTLGITEETCNQIRRDMKRILDRKIPGARVHGCRSVVGGVAVPVVTFP